nr:hypothetical protein [Ningiella sp. W23]
MLTTVDQSFAQRVLIVDDEPTSLMILEGHYQILQKLYVAILVLAPLKKHSSFYLKLFY